MKTNKNTVNTDKFLMGANLTIVNFQLKNLEIELERIDRKKSKLLSKARQSPTGRFNKDQRESFDKLCENERKAELKKEDLLTERAKLLFIMQSPERDAFDEIKSLRERTKEQAREIDPPDR